MWVSIRKLYFAHYAHLGTGKWAEIQMSVMSGRRSSVYGLSQAKSSITIVKLQHGKNSSKYHSLLHDYIASITSWLGLMTILELITCLKFNMQISLHKSLLVFRHWWYKNSYFTSCENFLNVPYKTADVPTFGWQLVITVIIFFLFHFCW